MKDPHTSRVNLLLDLLAREKEISSGLAAQLEHQTSETERYKNAMEAASSNNTALRDRIRELEGKR